MGPSQGQGRLLSGGASAVGQPRLSLRRLFVSGECARDLCENVRASVFVLSVPPLDLFRIVDRSRVHARARLCVHMLACITRERVSTIVALWLSAWSGCRRDYYLVVVVATVVVFVVDRRDGSL